MENHGWILSNYNNFWVGQQILAHFLDPDILAQNSSVMVQYPEYPTDTLKLRIPDYNNGPYAASSTVPFWSIMPKVALLNPCWQHSMYKSMGGSVYEPTLPIVLWRVVSMIFGSVDHCIHGIWTHILPHKDKCWELRYSFNLTNNLSYLAY